MKLRSALVLSAVLAAAPAVFAQAAATAPAAAAANLQAAAPDELIRSVSNDVLAQIKTEIKRPLVLETSLRSPLKHTAINQKTDLAGLDQGTGAGHFASGTEKA